jgi:hypothetical protein
MRFGTLSLNLCFLVVAWFSLTQQLIHEPKPRNSHRAGPPSGCPSWADFCINPGWAGLGGSRPGREDHIGPTSACHPDGPSRDCLVRVEIEHHRSRFISFGPVFMPGVGPASPSSFIIQHHHHMPVLGCPMLRPAYSSLSHVTRSLLSSEGGTIASLGFQGQAGDKTT